MNDLQKAIKVIKQGGIVIFPTDTAFGIGCRIDDESSLKRLFKIRKRPTDKAMPVLFDSIDRVNRYVLSYDFRVQSIMEKYWPGALTLGYIVKVDLVSSLVRGGGTTVGVRIPDHKTIIDLIKGADIPITGSSANFAGEQTPFSFEGLDKSLIKLVDLVLEGKTKGNRLSSTVVDVSNQPWHIVRQGSVLLPDL